MANLLDNQGRYYYLDFAPKRSPWGIWNDFEADYVRIGANGLLVIVSTESHGGIWANKAAQALLPAGVTEQDWYEEDVEARVWKALFAEEFIKSGIYNNPELTAEKLRASALKNLRRYKEYQLWADAVEAYLRNRNIAIAA